MPSIFFIGWYSALVNLNDLHCDGRYMYIVRVAIVDRILHTCILLIYLLDSEDFMYFMIFNPNRIHFNLYVIRNQTLHNSFKYFLYMCFGIIKCNYRFK